MDHPTKIQAVIYCTDTGDLKILVLKRKGSDGDSWQITTGEVVDDESTFEALRREIIEETGLAVLEEVSSEPICSFVENEGAPNCVSEYVYAVRVRIDEPVVLKIDYEEYLWMSPEGAIELVYSERQKEAIRALQNVMADASSRR